MYLLPQSIHSQVAGFRFGSESTTPLHTRPSARRRGIEQRRVSGHRSVFQQRRSAHKIDYANHRLGTVDVGEVQFLTEGEMDGLLLAAAGSPKRSSNIERRIRLTRIA